MKKVNILLSSYNGEKYIAEQIDSVMNQLDVEILLTIRDDGSTDRTVSIAEGKAEEYPGRIKVICGNNVGYRRSFLALLKLAEHSDYYGFCDQDDYWLPEKCIKAIEKIESVQKLCVLYASGVILTDENLTVIGKTDSWNMPLTVESYFTRQRLAGCTYIFDNDLRNIALRFCEINYPNAQMPDHDFVLGSCAFSCGSVVLDRDTYIYHRRHGNSVTSGGLGVLNRIKVESDLVFKRQLVQSTMARELLDKCNENLSIETAAFLKTVVKYKDSFANMISLLNNNKMTTNMWYCDIETKIKIILRNY